jgi:hypothetical protein
VEHAAVREASDYAIPRVHFSFSGSAND